MPHLLFSKLWNSSLCRSIFISVSRAGCPRLERLRLFIHPQTPFNFSSLVLRCPPFPSPLCQISPFLSVLMDYGLRLTVGHYSGSKHNFRPFILAWIRSLLPPALFQRKLAWFFPACTFRHLTLFSRLLTAPVNLPSVSYTSSRVWALIKLLFVARLPPPESTFISCFGLNKDMKSSLTRFVSVPPSTPSFNIPVYATSTPSQRPPSPWGWSQQPSRFWHLTLLFSASAKVILHLIPSFRLSLFSLAHTRSFWPSLV